MASSRARAGSACRARASRSISVLSRSDGEKVRNRGVPWQMRLAWVWCRMVFRTSWVPGMLRLRASVLSKTWLQGGVRQWEPLSLY